MHRLRLVALVFAAGLLAACSDSAPPAEPATPAAAQELIVAAAPVDEAGLRQAAASALSEQRFYAPAGDNAIEHYLALRRLRPEDRDLATALLELLPYALIATEQAVGRGDFDEARRLIVLIEQADPQAPSLPRLRESVVVAEAAATQRVVAEAEAAKRAALEAQLAAEAAARAREASAAETTSAPAPAAAVAAPPAVATAPPPATQPAPAATPPAPRSAPPPAPALPRLLSAAPPRYPLMAMRRKIEGNVTVQFTIQPDGSVASPNVVSADPPGIFDQAALAAARSWRFETGARPVSTSREVRFRLGEAAN
jgi:protein TonB